MLINKEKKKLKNGRKQLHLPFGKRKDFSIKDYSQNLTIFNKINFFFFFSETKNF